MTTTRYTRLNRPPIEPATRTHPERTGRNDADGRRAHRVPSIKERGRIHEPHSNHWKMAPFTGLRAMRALDCPDLLWTIDSRSLLPVGGES